MLFQTLTNKEFYKLFWTMQSNSLKEFYLPYKIFFITMIPFLFLIYLFFYLKTMVDAEINEILKEQESS